MIRTNITDKPRVLIVDDVAANLIALEAALQDLECELMRADSGNDALKLLLEHDYAVILLDVQMPEMDGFEVARLARGNERSQNTPIIFLTAMHDTEEAELRGYGTGAVDFLFKPFNPRVIKSKVQVFLDLYVQRRQLAEEIVAHKCTMAELEAFNYSVSHDLRAPLRAIDGFSRILVEDFGPDLNDEAKSHLDRIRGSAQRMDHLIRDLLELSRTTRAQVRKRSIDLGEVSAGVFERLRAAHPERTVETTVGPNLGAFGDPALLGIVMENLIGNAWKFTMKRSDARIELGSLPADFPTYFVRDNGAGFEMGQVTRLFRAFQRLHSTSEFEGTGIGLATVRRIVERHGGRVWAESRPNEGACFFFTLGGSTLDPTFGDVRGLD